MIAGIGQGYNVATLLQLAGATATLAADGRHYRPRLVHALRSSFDQPPKPLPAELIDPALVQNPAHLKLVQRGLEAVLNSPTGTARAVAQGASYRMAGKTGTAQRVSRNRDSETQRTLREGQRNQALFVGYAPTEAPRIAIAVVVEQGGSGSQAAAPVARRIFDAWLGGAGNGESGTEKREAAEPADSPEPQAASDEDEGRADAEPGTGDREAGDPADPEAPEEPQAATGEGTENRESVAP